MTTKFNFCAIIIGPPEHGKTSALRSLVREHLGAHETGLALVHDPNRQLRDICAVYEDAAAWRRAFDAACKSGEPFPRGASIGGKAEHVRDEAIALGKARNESDNVRIPILLAMDESSLMGTSSAHHLGDEDRELLSNRRHWGIGPVYNAQTVTGLHESFFTLATVVIVFAQQSERETEKLELRIGVPEGSSRGLVNAPPFRFLRFERGKGFV